MLQNSRPRLLPARLVVALAAVVLLSGVGGPAVARDARGSAWNSVGAVGAGHLDPGLSTVGDALTAVIVTAADGVQAATQAVRRAGGRAGTALHLVGGLQAEVPASRLVELSRTPGVLGVSADRKGFFEELSYDAEAVASGFVKSTQATALWGAGHLGQGVGVAVLDTGIAETKDFYGRLVHGPDLSGEGLTHDTYGHGTVMAGAVGGSGADSALDRAGANAGVAPKATLVSVKLAGRNGSVDVSTVLQGMHWVSAYAKQYNIRVVNLSFGVHSTQDPAVDPLNYAVQRLWQQGLVVVVAAGNSGPGARTLTKPADDPLVLTVGAFDDKGTGKPEDDKAVAWSSQGPTAQGLAKPDLVAPGRSLVVARAFGSKVEAENPKALVSPSYIRGSGSSQAAAVTSGAAALLLSARPGLTPDQVKGLLTGTALKLPLEPHSVQGAGRLQLAPALVAPAGPALTQTPTATGLGSIEASRGGRNVTTLCPGSATATVIIGEVDVRCEAWNPAAWTGRAWTGDAWNGSSWQGSSWQGSSWQGSSWQGGAWTGSSWQGSSWQGSSWQGSSWQGSSWQGSSWQGSSWQGSSWQGSAWTGSTYDEEDPAFLTAWYGHRPPAWKRIPGEASESSESGVAIKPCQVSTTRCR